MLDSRPRVCEALGEPRAAWKRSVIEQEVTLVRKALVAFFSGALSVVLWASAAWAQGDYPPPIPAGGDAARPPGVVSQPTAGQLPRTGASNTPSLILIGVAALVVGLVLVLAVRRRRALARGIA
jgi:LPXTG-motif cell wall-anchored protein